MKHTKILFIILFIINVNTHYSQDCGDNMSTLKFVEGFPYGGTAFTLDYQDIRIIKWNNSKISCNPIYLDTINTIVDIPFELLDEISNMNTFYSQMISDWNNSYGLQLAINPNTDNIKVQFSDNPILFESGDPNAPGVGRTILPVEVVS
ncbi:MAG: hypothetical protein STSR0008_20920 [Ignavibacterium sp.]